MTVKDLDELAEFAPFQQAHFFRVYKCPRCPNAHVVLLDRENKPFAQFVVGPENVLHLADEAAEVFEATQHPGLTVQ